MIDVSVGDHFGDSDHNSISFKILVEKDRSSPRVTVLNWGKANYDSIRQELGNVDRGRQFDGKSISDMWESFKSQLLTIQDKYIAVKKKKEAYINFRKLKTDKALEEYKENRKELKQGLRRAKRGHEMSLAGWIKEIPKAFYAYIRGKRVAKERLGPLKDSGGNLCMQPDEVGEVLNEYFASVFIKEKDVVDGECRKDGC